MDFFIFAVDFLLGFDQSFVQNKLNFIINITCKTLYEDFNGTNVFLDIIQSDKRVFNTEVYCSSMLKIPILNSMDEATATISWTPDESTHCLVQSENVPIILSRNQTTTVVASVLVPIILLIGIANVVVILSVLVSTCTLFHCKNNNKYLSLKYDLNKTVHCQIYGIQAKKKQVWFNQNFACSIT